VRDELLASNPAARVKRPDVSRTEAHYLSIAEVASLLEAVKDSRYAPLLRLLVATGLRRGEALALRWSDVDLTNGLLRVEPKAKRSRRDVPLSPATAALLRSVKASQAVEPLKAASIWVETGLVFTTERGTAVDPRNAQSPLNERQSKQLEALADASRLVRMGSASGLPDASRARTSRFPVPGSSRGAAGPRRARC